jgi:hypothetical protein
LLKATRQRLHGTPPSATPPVTMRSSSAVN